MCALTNAVNETCLNRHHVGRGHVNRTTMLAGNRQPLNCLETQLTTALTFVNMPETGRLCWGSPPSYSSAVPLYLVDTLACRAGFILVTCSM